MARIPPSASPAGWTTTSATARATRRAAIDLLQSRCGLGAARGGGGCRLGHRHSHAAAAGARRRRSSAWSPTTACAPRPRHCWRAIRAFAASRAAAEATTLERREHRSVGRRPGISLVQGRPRARHEALRIARPGAFGALLWNERPTGGQRVSRPTTRRWCGATPPSTTRSSAAARMRRACARSSAGAMELRHLRQSAGVRLRGARGPADVLLVCARARGSRSTRRCWLSCAQIFERHARAGKVVFPYVTLVYYGRLKPAR